MNQAVTKGIIIDRYDFIVGTPAQPLADRAIRCDLQMSDDEIKELEGALYEYSNGKGSYATMNMSDAEKHAYWRQWRELWLLDQKDQEPKPLPFNAIVVSRKADIDNTGNMSLYTLEATNIKTNSAQHVLLEVLPQVLELFLVKNQDYGDEMNAMKLGAKGQFVDIWRKVGKLKGALWDGKSMVGEQADEILMDLVGHILLALSEMSRAAT